MARSKTSIIVENSTRNELRRLERKEQTYDQVINELIKIKQNLELGRKRTISSDYQSLKSLSDKSN